MYPASSDLQVIALFCQFMICLVSICHKDPFESFQELSWMFGISGLLIFIDDGRMDIILC